MTTIPHNLTDLPVIAGVVALAGAFTVAITAFSKKDHSIEAGCVFAFCQTREGIGMDAFARRHDADSVVVCALLW